MRPWRALAFAGPAVEAVAVVQQLAWHRAHPTTEPVSNLFLAHAGIYAGIVVGALGAAAWWSEPRWRPAAALALVAALVRLVALAADLRLHSIGGDALPAHDAYRLGLALALAAAVVALATLARTRLAAGDAHEERRDREHGQD